MISSVKVDKIIHTVLKFWIMYEPIIAVFLFSRQRWISENHSFVFLDSQSNNTCWTVQCRDHSHMQDKGEKNFQKTLHKLLNLLLTESVSHWNTIWWILTSIFRRDLNIMKKNAMRIMRVKNFLKLDFISGLYFFFFVFFKQPNPVKFWNPFH